MPNLEMRNLSDHYPQREDQVEAWIKQRRDENPHGGAYDSLDALLDEYRLAADTGRSLEEMVNEELYAEQAQKDQELLRKRKPKKPR